MGWGLAVEEEENLSIKKTQKNSKRLPNFV